MISTFPYAAWIRVAVAMFAAPVATSLTVAQTLSGHVASASGPAVAGATVFVYTAAPKSGTSPFCPSCYPDCGKTARSDAAGNFAIFGLSSQLVFRLLVVAKDYAPKLVSNIEPGSGVIEVALEPRRNTDAPPAQTVTGRVVDPQGAPVHGAVIEILGVFFEGWRGRYGGLHETDPLAVTDEKGEFVFASNAPLVAIEARISARLFANQAVRLAMGQSHTLTLTEGATLSGRVTLDGKPVPNVAVGVSPQDRRAGSYVGHFEVGTDADGRFSFTNLPAKTDYFLYGLMETMGRHGAIPIRPVHVGRDHETTDLANVAVGPGYRLSGRVVLADGVGIPEKTRLLVSRDQAWDSLTVELGPNGEFDIGGVPAETVALSVRVSGYQVSAKNQSYDVANRRLVGRVEGDISGLELLLEKTGPLDLSLSTNAPPPLPRAAEIPNGRPLHGVELSPK